MSIFKQIIYFIIAILIVGFNRAACAAEIAGHSAKLKIGETKTETYPSLNEYFFKAKAIEEILSEYQSPLVQESEIFIKSCKKYNLNCYLLPSIAGLESSFGRFIYPQSYNPFGWGGGYIIFSNWSDAIDTVAKGLKENYLDKGAKTVDEIGVIYSQSPTWAVRVNWFINQFEQKEKEIRLRFIKNELKL